MPYKDIEARRAYLNKWRKNNKDKARQHRKTQKYKTKKFVDRVALRFGCSKCGYKKCVAALHFHHVDDKTYGISEMVRKNYSRKKIKKEMRKCVILCANCHAEEHYNNGVVF